MESKRTLSKSFRVNKKRKWIIKIALESQLGTKEWKKIISKLYAGYND